MANPFKVGTFERAQAKTFEKALEEVINFHCEENGSDTPDFILAEYLKNCLAAFNMAIKARRNWYNSEGE